MLATPAADEPPSREGILSRALSADDLLVVSDLRTESLEPLIRLHRGRSFERGERRVSVQPLARLAHLEPSDPQLLLWVGTARQASSLFEEGAPFAALAARQPHPGEVLYAQAAIADPPYRVIQALIGGDEAALRRELASPRRSRTDFLLLADGVVTCYGRLVGPNLPWQLGASHHLGENCLDQGTLRVVALDYDAADIAAFAKHAAEQFERCLALLKVQVPSSPATLVIYPSLESLVLATNSAEASLVTPDGRAHVWPGAGSLRCDGLVEAQLAVGGSGLTFANSRAREALEDYLANDLFGETSSFWEAWIALSGGAPNLDEIVATGGEQRLSPLIRRPFLAAFASAIAAHVNSADLVLTVAHALAAFDGGGVPLDLGRKATFDQLRTWYQEEIARAVKQEGPRVAARRKRRAAENALPDFQRGFCFAHEGYNVVDGYGSEQARESLQQLVALGANTISVTPFGYAPDLDRPTFEPFARFGGGPGGENDVAVAHACLEARSLGLAAMLKPHVWTAHRTWCGDLRMHSDTDWREFFSRYGAFIAHYAFLAEVLELPALCVATELKGTTGAENASRWLELIARCRGLFAGQITYAANWGEEAERLPFASELDFVGVNAYWPLADHPGASDDELEQGARHVVRELTMIARHTSKKVVLTEVGFAATENCYLHPFSEEAPYQEPAVDQARAFRALLSALRRQSWLGGLYVWKWPTNLPGSTSMLHHSVFCPAGRPAEQVISEAFSGSGR
jgi:hypothetical protein